MKHSKTLVLGVGNTLLTDEGAGVHALNLFQLYHPDSPYIEECTNLIVFDAAQLHAQPGTVESFAGQEMDAFLAKGSRSPHEVGLLDLLDIARLTGSLPANRALIGIQPGYMDWGMAPTDEVRDALANAVRAAEDLLAAWDRQASQTQDRAVA